MSGAFGRGPFKVRLEDANEENTGEVREVMAAGVSIRARLRS